MLLTARKHTNIEKQKAIFSIISKRLSDSSKDFDSK